MDSVKKPLWLVWENNNRLAKDINYETNAIIIQNGDDLRQVWPINSIFFLFPFCKRFPLKSFLPGGQINDPSSRKYFTLPFLPATL